MKVQVVRDGAAGTLSVHVQGYRPAVEPARLAAALASVVENALTERPAPTRPVTADEQPRSVTGTRQADPATLDTARPAAPPAAQRPAPVRTTCSTAAAPVAAPSVAAPSVGSAVTAEVAVAPSVPAGGSEPDEALRRTALTLLDDGLTDDQVCARLGISRSRLLRLDDPDREFRARPADRFAPVTA
jgi:hypothetical protein